jgi:hypothetical protein
MVLEHVAQPMGEQLDLLGPRQCVVDVAVDLSEHPVNDQVLQLLLTTDVTIERAGDHPQTRA